MRKCKVLKGIVVRIGLWSIVLRLPESSREKAAKPFEKSSQKLEWLWIVSSGKDAAVLYEAGQWDHCASWCVADANSVCLPPPCLSGMVQTHCGSNAVHLSTRAPCTQPPQPSIAKSPHRMTVEISAKKQRNQAVAENDDSNREAQNQCKTFWLAYSIGAGQQRSPDTRVPTQQCPFPSTPPWEQEKEVLSEAPY
ncbi:hypothetical protein H920_01050 [Fukomys damarensis]|uniref:Uncharacterized protein n=1 Tax=Fukomys damarensis TaxID=885580 RepID=A0A091E4Q5_FUKDA|nr:hypothetical protein H920_01050 [Fukomys damarensis]